MKYIFIFFHCTRHLPDSDIIRKKLKAKTINTLAHIIVSQCCHGHTDHDKNRNDEISTTDTNTCPDALMLICFKSAEKRVISLLHDRGPKRIQKTVHPFLKLWTENNRIQMNLSVYFPQFFFYHHTGCLSQDCIIYNNIPHWSYPLSIHFFLSCSFALRAI